MENLMAITQADSNLLTEFIEEHRIKSVLEFGAGVSTKLFDDLGMKVESLETDLRHAKAIASELKSISIYCWEGIVENYISNICQRSEAELVFIDGPEGGQNREPSYQLALMTKARFIACHDAQRDYEAKWIKKYLSTYTLVKANARLFIYEKRSCTAKVLLAMPMPKNFRMDFETMRFCTLSMKKEWHWLNCPSVEPTLGRNMLITWFLKKEELADYTHLFFLDADTVPPPNTIERLICHDKDMIGGLTPLWLRRQVYWNAQIEKDKMIPAQNLPIGITKVKRIGGTTTLIKRHVLESLDYPFFKIECPQSVDEAIKKGPILKGSDYYFCDKVCEAGFDIYVDPEILCKHIKLIDLLDLAVEFK